MHVMCTFTSTSKFSRIFLDQTEKASHKNCFWFIKEIVSFIIIPMWGHANWSVFILSFKKISLILDFEIIICEFAFRILYFARIYFTVVSNMGQANRNSFKKIRFSVFWKWFDSIFDFWRFLSGIQKNVTLAFFWNLTRKREITKLVVFLSMFYCCYHEFWSVSFLSKINCTVYKLK